MAEQINSQTWITSGEHEWLWGQVNATSKTLGISGVRGEAMITPHVGGQQLVIRGLLKDTSVGNLAAKESQILKMIIARQPVAWEDNEGRRGNSLVLLDYRQTASRVYRCGGGAVWQRYEISALELDGGIAI